MSRSGADVPDGDAWLSDRERAVLHDLRTEVRRQSWRLGRWTAKQVLSLHGGVPAGCFEIRTAPDGAPEAWQDGSRLAVSLSISHRAGRGMAALADDPTVVGCDLELIEPRSAAFIREWFAPPEQDLITATDPAFSAVLANLIWTAKEAAAKVRREGLRLNVRHAVVDLGDFAVERNDGWNALRVQWSECDRVTQGWWRREDQWVATIALEAEPGAERLTPRCADQLGLRSWAGRL